MAAYSSKGSSTLEPQFIAPQANPKSKLWKSRVNCSVLPDREFGSKQAPHVATIENAPPLTPVTKHGTLVQDDGDGLAAAFLRSRAKHDKGSVPSA